jgi:hypothetical protein
MVMNLRCTFQNIVIVVINAKNNRVTESKKAML